MLPVLSEKNTPYPITAKLIPLKNNICNLGEASNGNKEQLFIIIIETIKLNTKQAIFLNSFSLIDLLLEFPIKSKGDINNSNSELYHTLTWNKSILEVLTQYRNKLWLANNSKTNNPVIKALLSFN